MAYKIGGGDDDSGGEVGAREGEGLAAGKRKAERRKTAAPAREKEDGGFSL